MNMTTLNYPSLQGEITRNLARWSDGDMDALNEVFSKLYPELKKTAVHFLETQSSQTLRPTMLIHEAYLRLRNNHGAQFSCRAQFFALAAKVMRRILVDHFRARSAEKRGAGERNLALDEVLELSQHQAVEPAELVALDRALKKLEGLDARQCRIVELRFFGGLTVEEMTEIPGLSRTTLIREWRLARLWLAHELSLKTDLS